MTPKKRLLAVTPRQAAQMLSVSEPTLAKLDIPRMDLGPRLVRYSVEDIRAWIREKSHVRQPLESQTTESSEA